MQFGIFISDFTTKLGKNELIHIRLGDGSYFTNKMRVLTLV